MAAPISSLAGPTQVAAPDRAVAPGAANDLAPQPVAPHNVRLVVELLNGNTVNRAVLVSHDALPSKAMAFLSEAAKSQLTRPEKAGLALHIYKMEVYRDSVSGPQKCPSHHQVEAYQMMSQAGHPNPGAVQDEGLLQALGKHPIVDANPKAFFTQYADVFAGDATVRLKVSVNKPALSRIGKFVTMASALTVQIVLGA
jgi:hypothetical protein